MRLNRTDVIATAVVAVAETIYLLWLTDVAIPGLGSPRAIGGVVLGLGFVASFIAVVPGFGVLIRSSRIYLVATSTVGLLAFAAGLVVLITADETLLAVLAASTAAMWVAATVRHILTGRRREHPAPVTAPTARTIAEKQRVGAGR